MSEVSVNLLVAGRGHSLADSETLGLSTIQRVDTAVDYYHQHQSEFATADDAGLQPSIVMSGGYATMATGYRILSPPASKREGSLMLTHAEQQGVPLRYLHKSITPTTTLEVVLRPLEEGYFRNINPHNPLGIVTQATQWERLAWLAERAYDISPSSLQLIEAPGEDSAQIKNDEEKLMRMTKILYGLAHTSKSLRRAERIAEVSSNVLTKLGLQQPPAVNYLQN
jgi:hypothetical protein